MRRREHDHDTFVPPERREDILEEIVQHGSRNFRAYRVRATVAFAVLTVATSFALYMAVTERNKRDRALTRAGRETALRACREDNDQAERIVKFVAQVAPELVDKVVVAFPQRDCVRIIQPLERP